jgi:hypothetical protein
MFPTQKQNTWESYHFEHTKMELMSCVSSQEWFLRRPVRGRHENCRRHSGCTAQMLPVAFGTIDGEFTLRPYRDLGRPHRPSIMVTGHKLGLLERAPLCTTRAFRPSGSSVSLHPKAHAETRCSCSSPETRLREQWCLSVALCRSNNKPDSRNQVKRIIRPLG